MPLNQPRQSKLIAVPILSLLCFKPFMAPIIIKLKIILLACLWGPPGLCPPPNLIFYLHPLPLSPLCIPLGSFHLTDWPWNLLSSLSLSLFFRSFLDPRDEASFLSGSRICTCDFYFSREDNFHEDRFVMFLSLPYPWHPVQCLAGSVCSGKVCWKKKETWAFQ